MHANVAPVAAAGAGATATLTIRHAPQAIGARSMPKESRSSVASQAPAPVRQAHTDGPEGCAESAVGHGQGRPGGVTLHWPE